MRRPEQEVSSAGQQNLFQQIGSNRVHHQHHCLEEEGQQKHDLAAGCSRNMYKETAIACMGEGIMYNIVYNII
jgi:hypothetical protein